MSEIFLVNNFVNNLHGSKSLFVVVVYYFVYKVRMFRTIYSLIQNPTECFPVFLPLRIWQKDYYTYLIPPSLP